MNEWPLEGWPQLKSTEKEGLASLTFMNWARSSSLSAQKAKRSKRCHLDAKFKGA